MLCIRQQCLHMFLDINQYHFMSIDDEVRHQTNQLLTEIIQARDLPLFGHLACIYGNTDSKQILTSSPSVDGKRMLGRP